MSKPINGGQSEYAKHLRKYSKRRVGKIERRSAKASIQKGQA